MKAGILQRLAVPAAWAAILLLAAWAYWPGLNGPLLLDDSVNLRPLERIELNEDFSADVMTDNRSGLFGRPVSMATFTIERMYFDHGTYGQKRTGLFLHLLNATLVLLLAHTLMRAAGQRNATLTAFLVAAAWLTLPLLLSTTLYVIQRMTLLSAGFTLLALICYCRGRESDASTAWGWFTATAAAALLAALSKGNGLLALPLIVAVEIFIYEFRGHDGQVRRPLVWALAALVSGAALALMVLAIAAPDFFVGGYSLRPFTLEERLLTQGRVLIDYLRQILWVDVHRLGLYHDDFSVSTGLLSPPGTALALMFWVFAAAAIVVSMIYRRFRLLAFGMAFFMIGHAMESTIIPLELYFEHRNYLPSFGVVFGTMAVANQLQARWPLLRGWIAMAAILFIGRNLLLLSSQAIVWSDVHLVNMEAVNNHPDSERALLSLAAVYAAGGHLQEALELMGRANAIAGRAGASAEVLEAVFYCLARQPLPEDMFEAQQLTDEQIAESYFGDHVYQMTRLVISGRCSRESGVVFADAIKHWLDARPGGPRAPMQIYGSLLLLENELERFPEALNYADLMVEKNPGDVMGLQFTLYLSQVLDQPKRGAAARSKLLEMKQRGELSRQQTYNLDLFLGDSE